MILLSHNKNIFFLVVVRTCTRKYLPVASQHIFVLFSNCIGEITPVSCIVGGILAQEIIKVLTFFYSLYTFFWDIQYFLSVIGLYYRVPQYCKTTKICLRTRQLRAIFSHKPQPSVLFSNVNILFRIAISCK